ncbi:uncharacterized protein ARB_01247 [Trichophyton benhamiae CBS 112371]|uniref:Vacuolar protein sorting-associated protein 74 n=1 Tax=Arthroderma benhamiae (strain ATCC MYA-4681 / CBS 112371) TaxID=663331 RepID=D4AYH8_ARTBC|nr:uncharacterized protein ARB_01247 [Trichophyton benhamiae CBS 112371]EFE31994.1 hypothetical protein ARB_01247 [Trichophyton benhamiae CBS 112371]
MCILLLYLAFFPGVFNLPGKTDSKAPFSTLASPSFILTRAEYIQEYFSLERRFCKLLKSDSRQAEIDQRDFYHFFPSSRDEEKTARQQLPDSPLPPDIHCCDRFEVAWFSPFTPLRFENTQRAFLCHTQLFPELVAARYRPTSELPGLFPCFLMASTSGLTRRRGAGRGDGGAESGRVASPASLNGASQEGRGESSFTGENGHKIAFDPRDISENEERSKQPKLTLMEEVLLLGLKDKQGYLSFWNENISYALRGCIVIELAFRGRISMQKDSSRRRFPLADRIIEVIDDTLTGEVLLDEALKMMKASEKMSVSSWIDLMSGETWNLMKIGYQLKQVRERLAKGLVDKGVLRTEKRNFLLFDMATHPVADGGAKEELHKRVRNICSSRTVMLPPNQFLPEDIEFRYLRTIALVCAAYAANVLENALVTMGHEARERAFAQVDELLAEYSQWPFVSNKGAGAHVIGANLPQAVAEEVERAKDKELQLEVYSLALTPCFKRPPLYRPIIKAGSMPINVLYLHFITSTFLYLLLLSGHLFYPSASLLLAHAQMCS